MATTILEIVDETIRLQITINEDTIRCEVSAMPEDSRMFDATDGERYLAESKEGAVSWVVETIIDMIDTDQPAEIMESAIEELRQELDEDVRISNEWDVP